jgi:hypothetical protein
MEIAPALIDAMPVNRGRVRSMILGGDDNRVTLVAANELSWKLAIDGQQRTIDAVGIGRDLVDNSVV